MLIIGSGDMLMVQSIAMITHHILRGNIYVHFLITSISNPIRMFVKAI